MTGLLYRVYRFRKFIVMVHLLKRALFTAHSIHAVEYVILQTRASVIDMEIVKLISDYFFVVSTLLLKNGT